MQDGRHPIGRSSRQSIVDRLALELVHRGNRRELPTIIQAVHVDDCAHTFRHLRDSRDEDAASTADEKIAGAGAKPVSLNKRPIIRPHLERSLRVGEHARIMIAAERAGTCPKRIVLWWLRQPEAHVNVAAMTSAQTVHASILTPRSIYNAG